MNDHCLNGTGHIACLLGAGVNACNAICMELDNENGIVDGLESGNGIFVGVGVGTIIGVRIGEERGIDKIIEILGGDGIKSLLGLGDGIIIHLDDVLGDHDGFGLEIGVLDNSAGFGFGILVNVVSHSRFLINLAGYGDGGAGLECNLVGVDDGMRDVSGYDT